MDDGIQLVLGGGTAGALITMLGNWLISKSTRRNRIEPQPLEIKPAEQYVRCTDCVEHRRVIESHHEELAVEVRGERKALQELLSGIRKQLTHNDEKAEERSVNLHRRIDPLIEAVGSLKGRVDDHIRAPH